MPFVPINPTNTRTNLWNFGDNCSAFGGGWKTQLFWVGHFEFFFQKKIIFFASFLFKLVTIYGIPRIFWNFDNYPDFQQKGRGLQNYEKHCTYILIIGSFFNFQQSLQQSLADFSQLKLLGVMRLQNPSLGKFRCKGTIPTYVGLLSLMTKSYWVLLLVFTIPRIWILPMIWMISNQKLVNIQSKG